LENGDPERMAKCKEIGRFYDVNQAFMKHGSVIAKACSPKNEVAMKVWSIVAVEISMALTGIGMIGLMIVVALY
jgi:hypothetical protein